MRIGSGATLQVIPFFFFSIRISLPEFPSRIIVNPFQQSKACSCLSGIPLSGGWISFHTYLIFASKFLLSSACWGQVRKQFRRSNIWKILPFGTWRTQISDTSLLLNTRQHSYSSITINATQHLGPVLPESFLISEQ